MAKSNLDPVIRALVGVDRNHLGVVADIANRLNSPNASRWHERFADVLQEGLPPLLAFDDQHIATVALVHPHDPQTFWQDTRESPARYVWGTFTTTVVAKARPIEESGTVKIPFADLLRDTTVRAILDTLDVGDHDPSRLSKIIASMIAAQPNGEFSKDGLLNDGKANLFRCGSVLGRVGWDDVVRRWVVDGWGPGGDVDAGRRMFSCNLKL